MGAWVLGLACLFVWGLVVGGSLAVAVASGWVS